MSRTFHHDRREHASRAGMPEWQYRRERRAQHKAAAQNGRADLWRLADGGAVDRYFFGN